MVDGVDVAQAGPRDIMTLRRAGQATRCREDVAVIDLVNEASPQIGVDRLLATLQPVSAWREI